MTDIVPDPRARRRAWEAEYRERNRERLREYNRQWHRRNPDKNRAKVRKYMSSAKGREAWKRISTSEKYKARQAAYRAKANENTQRWYSSKLEENRLRKAVNEARRRVRKHHSGGVATLEQVKARLAYWGYRCWICREPWEAIDHVIPIALGGTGWPANLRPICQRCNSSKGVRTLHR